MREPAFPKDGEVGGGWARDASGHPARAVRPPTASDTSDTSDTAPPPYLGARRALSWAFRAGARWRPARSWLRPAPREAAGDALRPRRRRLLASPPEPGFQVPARTSQRPGRGADTALPGAARWTAPGAAGRAGGAGGEGGARGARGQDVPQRVG